MISVIVPSRGRPDDLLIASDSLKLSENGLEMLVWLDNDDPKLPKYKKLFESKPNVKLFIKDRVGYMGSHIMLNFLCEQAKHDWILQFNDDAYMDNPDWFSLFKDFVRQFEPTNQPIAINIWDQSDSGWFVFPIVSRKYIDLVGHYTPAPCCEIWIKAVADGANITYRLKGLRPMHIKGVNKDSTLKEADQGWEEMKRKGILPNRSPYRQMVREEIAKIVTYNMSREACQNLSRIKKIGFLGLGKLGLPIAETIANRGFDVIGYDPMPIKTSLPLGSSVTDVVNQSDIVFCAVQTPHDPLYEGDKLLPQTRADFDYSYLINAIKEVVAVDKETNLVVISTCLPGTFKREIEPLLSPKINYIYNPFFIAMGTVVEDYSNPEFALMGGKDTSILKFFYSKFYGRDRTFSTDITTAEGIKVFYNTYITTKTVLGNMYGEFAHKTGMNVDHIYQALSKATDRIISPKYLESGVADGGSCHPRDNIALSYLADKLDLSFNYFDAVMTAREKHMQWLADVFVDEINKTGLLGIVLGKSFKPGVTMQTGSAAILLANILKQKEIPFLHCEFDYPRVLPQAVYFIATKHEKYRNLPFPNGSVVIDPFRYIPEVDGISVIQIGKK